MKELSVDLIESCLNQIYKIRKAQLSHRTQKHQERILRQQKVINAKYDLTIKPKQEEEEEDEEDEENEELVKQMSTKSTAPLPPSKVNAAPTYVDSGKAREIFEAFCKEHESASQSITSDQELEDACNYFVEKYLTEQFDKMKPSAEVSKLKMTISKMIEDLASNGVIHKEEEKVALVEETFSKPVVGKLLSNKSSKGLDKSAHIPDSNTYSASSKAIAGKEQSKSSKSDHDSKASTSNSPTKSNPSTTMVVAEKPSPSNKTTTGPTPTTAADRKAGEKTKIKQQYEAYISLKKKYLEHEDHKVIADYEQLNNDIQNVLASIQTTGAKTSDGPAKK
jgi:hypothetical protein